MATVPKYHEDLRAPVQTEVGETPKVKVHRMEWSKVRGSDGAVRGWCESDTATVFSALAVCTVADSHVHSRL